MDDNLWHDLFPLIGALLSGGGILTLAIARKERKAAADLTNANAVEIIQKVYQQFVKDTALEIGQLKEEVRMLREVVQKYKDRCDSCPNKR